MPEISSRSLVQFPRKTNIGCEEKLFVPSVVARGC